MITAAEYTNHYARKELDTYVSEHSKLDNSDPVTKLYIESSLQSIAENHRKIAQKLMREFKGFRSSFNVQNDMIFQYFPLASLSKEEQLHYVYHIDNLKIDQGDIGNKYIYNLKKTSFDNLSQRLHPLYLNPPKETYLSKHQSILTEKYKNIISSHSFIHPLIMKDMIKICYSVAEKKEVESLHPLSDIVYNTLTNAIHHWVTPMSLSYQNRMDALTTIETFLDEFLENIKSKPVSISTDLETCVPIFLSILSTRTHFNEKLATYETFHKDKIQEQSTVKQLEDQYKKRLESNIPPEDDQSLRAILCEQQNKIRYESFRKKLDLARKTIDQLEKKGYNLDNNNLLSLKMVFRELFICKPDGKPSPSLKIARKLTSEKDDFSISPREESFLVERLDRVKLQFRVSTAFCNQFSRVQLKIIHILIENFLTYDVDTICSNLAYLFSEGTELCSAQLHKKEIGTFYVEINDFDIGWGDYDEEMEDSHEEFDL